MRAQSTQVGVLDIGCFSAHLVVVERARSSPLWPVLSHKIRLRLDQAMDSHGRIGQDAIDRITAAVSAAQRRIPQGVPVVGFATSSVRDAANSDQIIRRVFRRTGVELQTFSGEQEAHLSYIAARQWFGHSAGPLTVLDVGGGTAEIATGAGIQPLATYSLPFGARTLTRTWLDSSQTLPDMRAEVLDRVRKSLSGKELVGTAVGCSKVMQQLARLAGARPQREGPYVPRHLQLADLQKWIPRLAKLRASQRAELPGISRHRAQQSLAGAVVAEALLTATGHEQVNICPWSTKEGLLIRLLEDPRLVERSAFQAA
ncbi:exopolyphosphatase/guanosine-5'-triphosphate,3'-diphosphate pyrophosphatase [Kibdelosporangium banguiense]|uniref:Exopolyphosphatase/guanosine-5'-triphosphate, 3'-diphosphate pyrophosphatase n=1 Tax=Kibdelosporangium banguiense TaxID=1365924 RepID=A0ABS4TKZ2_9PSEU|nr:exopolyphosphatase [Kibdelosporangium banguiense]MBP2325075.1 exopolyphosphatase/guanosine-5'-triphosphate,3'-diphosphate pyrophosphatase [Kibdelosporangium banguiense]